MSNLKELSILSKWLEEKLKEHFVKKSQLRKTSWSIFSREPILSSFFVPNQCNGVVPIQTVVSDFRILDFKLERDKNRKKKAWKHPNGILPNKDQDHSHDQEDFNAPDKMFQSPPSASSTSWEKTGKLTDEPYQQNNSHVFLVYQETSQAVGKELRLEIKACQIVDVKAMEDIVPKYELSLDEHQIDVYTRVFPLLRHWVSHNKVLATLPVPECYYGSYETENQTGISEGVAAAEDDVYNDGLNDNIDDHLFEDDIMSKVAAGLEFYERDRKRREDGKQSSYRLLILDDISRQGFKLKNVGDSSTFLSLLNVEEALKSLAEIHSVSWAYAQLSGKSLLKTWPFLHNPLYLPYLKERVILGFSSMERLVHAYLICSGKETAEDARRILKSLGKLNPHLKEILEGAKHPRTVKCLIHQSACFSSFLFKYSVLTMTKDQKKMKQEKEKVELIKKKNDDYGRGNDNDNNNVGSSLSSPLNNNDDDVIPTARRECLEKGLSREVMIINWRTASVGSPMIDVAFLLLTALPPKTRRAETASLLRIYWDSFRLHAKKFGLSLRWSDKELYEDYWGALLYTCVLITGNIMGSQCELSDEGMEVFLEAVKDLMKENVI